MNQGCVMIECYDGDFLKKQQNKAMTELFRWIWCGNSKINEFKNRNGWYQRKRIFIGIKIYRNDWKAKVFR